MREHLETDDGDSIGIPEAWTFEPPPRQAGVPLSTTRGLAGGDLVVARNGSQWFDDLVLTHLDPQMHDDEPYIPLVTVVDWARWKTNPAGQFAMVYPVHLDDVWVYRDVPRDVPTYDFPAETEPRTSSKEPPPHEPRPARLSGRLTGSLVRVQANPETEELERGGWQWWIAAGERTRQSGGAIRVPLLTPEAWALREMRRAFWVADEFVWTY